MNIRRATADDAAALARVHIDAWKTAYRGLVPDSFLQALNYDKRAESFRQSIAGDSEEVYLAEEDGDVLGFLALGAAADSGTDRESIGEILSIYLAPAHWRKGIGTSLCRHAEQLLRSRGDAEAVVWVFEENDAARRFYEAMGFGPDGATNVLDRGAPLTALRYRKALAGAATSRG